MGHCAPQRCASHGRQHLHDPFLRRPLEFGADIVAQFLSDRGEVLGGALVCGRELAGTLRMEGLKNYTGGALSPMSALLIPRGLKTLPLRMEKHCANARQVAEFLASHRKVAEVLHPSRPDFPGRDVALKQLRDRGAMICLELKGGIAAGEKFIDSLSLIKPAVSLGNADTLCQHPATMTHSAYGAAERAKRGIADGSLRLAVGQEDADGIIAEIEQAPE